MAEKHPTQTQWVPTVPTPLLSPQPVPYLHQGPFLDQKGMEGKGSFTCFQAQPLDTVFLPLLSRPVSSANNV